MTTPPLLEISDLNGWYGKSHILKGINLHLKDGELLALLGRNGAGKTTTMRAITGLLARTSGEVRLAGQKLLGRTSYEIARLGLSLVPEHRGIFASLSVEENLSLAARRGSPWSVEQVWSMFPSLAARRRTAGGKLSGGEQQMLAIGRALTMGPRVLLLDEPTEGLAPVIVEQLVKLLQELKSSGLSILLVEQSLAVCTAVADRHVVLDGGSIVWEGTSPELTAASEMRARHLTLEHA
ncbi:MAG: ABC transporter ATP-binding protein [Hyphomicrobiales bacterium]|nr:ABC transporter ATP-binding protein [Hyphomicrobiales bacterium]MBV8661804.1 ABC transporter ATP-binding protein [Hyphomicrobiales bacterium]